MGRSKNLKIKKNLALVLILSFIILSPFFCCAADNLDDAFKKNGPLDQAAGQNGAGYNTTVAGPEGMISLIITTALSFIGVIFLLLAIYGGYTWMIARGNEQEVEKAKNILTAAVIGLIVVIAAYAVSWYIINVLGSVALSPTSNTSK
ncbi:pilin [Patescibacteria group bacterium]|nr:pilin [Patescibacteria group bacterium]MBU1663338.1 pilin [Patescibacteria group bacterium]MBU1933677.1 pilin [Patescibacteria group bacterium]MBU2008112.1 pilin [Patescibacteria group bacterium]MBU2233457.1 pilin [Patescibacteria group bacterium]